MANYAIFGATGNCGSSLIDIILKSSSSDIHAYCRSKEKLMRVVPTAADNKRLRVFEGQIDNVELFLDCIRNCRAVFLAVSMNDNVPGCRVAQDTTITLLAALRKLRGEGLKMPKIVVLSSSSLEDRLCRNLPSIGHWIVVRANSNVYEDLRVQERMLRAEEEWLSSIFMKPGGLVVDKQRGYKLDLELQDTFVSYLDLAAAMIEAADEPDNRYDMKDITVQNINGSAKFPLWLPPLCVCGLLRHFFPWLHPFLPLLG